MMSPSRRERIGHTTRNPRNNPATKFLLNVRESMGCLQVDRIAHDDIAKEAGRVTTHLRRKSEAASLQRAHSAQKATLTLTPANQLRGSAGSK